MTSQVMALKKILGDVVLFARYGSGVRLRRYQVEVARAITSSVVRKLGLTFVVIFPRQSGKNELQAQIETYLLSLLSTLNCEIVKVSPTWKPQTQNAMRRLERVLEKNMVARDRWSKESGYLYRVGRARIIFLSGSPSTHVVGATASTLLECDEAQDVLAAKWDKDFAPMAASTNATRVFWGTAWTSRTLLARELRAAREEEKKDGVKRVFMITADDVAKEVPAYGRFVAGQVARLGRNHPLVRTQFYCEEVDAEGGMFPPGRRALMQGMHLRQEGPAAGKTYALLLDVAGEDEGALDGESDAGLVNRRRDSTALTVVEADLGTLSDELIRAPSYRTVKRYCWTGIKHTQLYGQIKALAEHWEARYLVVDATGVGTGLASFLGKALGERRVIPYVFTLKSKSDLGWGFLAAIETGRYKEYAPAWAGQEVGRGQGPIEPVASPGDAEPPADALQETFWKQIEHCQSTVLDGPGKLMRWGVPDGARDPATGELVHDDLVLSAALCAVLDFQPWGLARSGVVAARDPLDGLGEVF